MKVPYFARLHFEGGYVELASVGRWTPSDPSLQGKADEANRLTRMPAYEYSPSHGKYGYQLAEQVGEQMGALRVEIYPQPDGPPGRIY